MAKKKKVVRKARKKTGEKCCRGASSKTKKSKIEKMKKLAKSGKSQKKNPGFFSKLFGR